MCQKPLPVLGLLKLVENEEFEVLFLQEGARVGALKVYR